MPYRHVQTSYLATFVLLATSVVLLGVMSAVGNDAIPITVVVIVAVALVFVGTVFSRMTVAVESSDVVVAFGFGWPARQIALSDITAMRRVRNRWYYGWGIHRVPGGWMYNVGGLDGVELDLRDGKAFRIGTDEPDRLAAVIAGGSGLGVPTDG